MKEKIVADLHQGETRRALESEYESEVSEEETEHTPKTNPGESNQSSTVEDKKKSSFWLSVYESGQGLLDEEACANMVGVDSIDP